MTNAQIIAALSQLAEAIRTLTERQIISEVTQKQTAEDIRALINTIEQTVRKTKEQTQ